MEPSQTVVSDNPPGREPFPVGMIVVLAFLSLELLSSLLQLSRTSTFPFGPYLLPPIVALAHSAAGVLALGAAIYGIVKRKAWGKNLAIAWLLIGAAVMASDVLVSLLHPQQTLALTHQLTQDYLAKHHVSFPGVQAAGGSRQMEVERAGLISGLVGGLMLTWGLNGIAIIYLLRQNSFFRL